MSTLRERVEAAYDFMRARLTESSTIRGLLIVLGAGTIESGWLSADKFPLVMAVVGVVAILVPDDLPWGGKP
jgi:hypothetical protein